MGGRIAPSFTCYEVGTCNTIDDESGFKVKFSNTLKRWEGYRVAPENWEPRQPQDFPVTPRAPKVYPSKSEILPTYEGDNVEL